MIFGPVEKCFVYQQTCYAILTFSNKEKVMCGDQISRINQAMSNYEKVLDIIFGRWRSQILYAGVKLGVFDLITSDSKNPSDFAKELDLDYLLTYRLLRALASIGMLKEKENLGFSITPQGELLRKDHPQTLRGIILLEEGPEHYAIWKHLIPMIKDGQQNAFVREYGHGIFEHTAKDIEYSEVFNQAMNSYSSIQTNWVLDAFDGYDFSKIHHLCDVGGGRGHLLSTMIAKYPHMKGTVFELESVAKNKDLLVAPIFGVGDRCSYVGGDMFNKVPSADAYIMKMILHDWNDDECVKILSNIRRSSPENGKVFIAEHLVPGPEIPHFSKLFDIHMMCAASGKERTVDEYSGLLKRAGWEYNQTLNPSSGLIGVIEASK
jgi:predicted transcriptional regulator